MSLCIRFYWNVCYCHHCYFIFFLGILYLITYYVVIELCIVATVVVIVGLQTVSHVGVFVINACGCQVAGGSCRGKSKKMFARPLMLFCSIQQYSFTEVTHFFNVCCRASHLRPDRLRETVRPTLGPTQLPLQWLPQVLCAGQTGWPFKLTRCCT
jgi:hypothetical protein